VVINPLERGVPEFEFVLELSEDWEKVYHFSALSRGSRDTIALLIRCFHARKYVATSFILSRLFQNPATPGAPLTGPIGREEFDVHGLGQRLGKELDRTVGQLESVERVVRTSNEEKRQLMEQLQETIGSYTEAIEKLHQQLAFAKGGPAAQLQLQVHDARAANQRLQLDAKDVQNRLEEEQRKAPAQSGTSEAEVLSAEITRLRASISSLAGEAASHSQRDHTRHEELRRLRQDVELLNGEKEGLEKCAFQAEKDKQDLVENFLYVKGLLDKLQMASLESPAASPEVEREIAQLKTTYSQVVDDRNRLAVRVEHLDRDREKQKAQRESALERVMNANARLLEERDRLEKEKARVSGLYQQTMGAMGAMPQAGAGYPGAGGSTADGASAADLEALKVELAQKTELLAKREQESESLRSRLRKLAMV
jgi:DNA repair exonuclease SbcCD ATPase subunit